MSLSVTLYEAEISLDWDGDTKVSFLILLIKTLFLVGNPSILVLGVMERQTMLPSLLCFVSRLVCPTQILNTILTNILFPLGKMIVANKLHYVKPVLLEKKERYI